MNTSNLTTPWWHSVLESEFWPVIDLALEVGNFQSEHFRCLNLTTETKSSGVDLVTEVDRTSDQRIVQVLRQLFPEDAILSEEGGQIQSTSRRLWIVDPLDGTTNFASGLPVFAVSIALWENGQPQFGVIFSPIIGDLAVSQIFKGAYLNGNRCSISTKETLNTCVVATGFPYDRATARNSNAENAARIIPKVRGLRRMGAAAYDLMLVAAGHLDAFWELRLSLWDIAAAKLMILESGGVFYEQESDGLYNIIVGNRSLVTQINTYVDLEN